MGLEKNPSGAETCFLVLMRMAKRVLKALFTHDSCNLAYNLGIIQLQRRIPRCLCPQFREMKPHRAENYCCGDGSGFAIMSGNNFTDRCAAVNGCKKLKRTLDAFSDQPKLEVKKYVCEPCSNSKSSVPRRPGVLQSS
jgi:hypothetical protein